MSLSATPVGRPILGSDCRIFQRIPPGFHRHHAGRAVIRVVAGSGKQRLPNRRLVDDHEMHHTNRLLRPGCLPRFDFLEQLTGGRRDVIAVLMDPAGGAIDRGGSTGDHEEPSAKAGHQITPAFLIELQPFENRPDSVWNPALLPLRQLPARPIQ